MDGKEIEHISTALGSSQENTALAAIFPDTEYWEIEEPRPFDFITNEGKAQWAMKEYLTRMKNYEGGLAYISSSPLGPIRAHEASPDELYAWGRQWEEEFWRVYKIAIASQKQGKDVRVAIFS
ncbi:MAG: hypothetical protein HY297_03715 [Thaumarchaeota archaeon]|nr:hypothetical protein [Nitrososphaerota archaeon]